MSRILFLRSRRTARFFIGIAAVVFLLSATGCEELGARRQIQKANKLYQSGRYSQAVEQYEAALAKADLPLGHHNAGLAYLKLFKEGIDTPENLGFADKATFHFTKYLAAYPEDTKIVQQLTRVWLDSGKYEQALEYWEKELAAEPDNTEIMAYLASINRQAGDWEKAVQWHRKQADAEPTQDAKVGALVDIAKLIWHKLSDKEKIVGLERVRVADVGIAALQKADAIQADNVEVQQYLAAIYQFRAMGHGPSWAQAVDKASSQLHQSRVKELSEQQNAPAQPKKAPEGEGQAPDQKDGASDDTGEQAKAPAGATN